MSDALYALRYLPKSVTSVDIYEQLHHESQYEDLEKFILALPWRVKRLKLETRELNIRARVVPESFIQTLAMCAPGLEEVELDGGWKDEWAPLVLDALDKTPFIGFRSLVMNPGCLKDARSLTRLITRLRSLSLRGIIENDEIGYSISKALASKSCNLERYRCVDWDPTLPLKFPPSMRTFELRFAFRVMRKHAKLILDMLRNSRDDHRLEVLIIDADCWHEEEDITKTCEAIAAMIRGIWKMHYTRKIPNHSIGILLDMLRSLECTLLDYACAVEVVDLIPMMRIVRKYTRIRNCEIYVDDLDWETEEVEERGRTRYMGFHAVLSSTWFAVVQVILSIRIVPRLLLSGGGLISQVPWLDHIRQICEVLGWPIQALFIPDEW